MWYEHLHLYIWRVVHEEHYTAGTKRQEYQFLKSNAVLLLFLNDWNNKYLRFQRILSFMTSKILINRTFSFWILNTSIIIVKTIIWVSGFDRKWLLCIEFLLWIMSFQWYWEVRGFWSEKMPNNFLLCFPDFADDKTYYVCNMLHYV